MIVPRLPSSANLKIRQAVGTIEFKICGFGSIRQRQNASGISVVCGIVVSAR